MRQAFRQIRKAVRRHWREHHAWPGKLVELTGNTVNVDGVRISVDNPLISRELKTSLWKGHYESKERRLLRAYLPPDLPLIELGACIGVISCISNRRLANPARHVVVEANQHLIPTLRHNRDANSCSFEIVRAAVGYDADEVVFYESEYCTSGSLCRPSEVRTLVPATSLQRVAEGAGFDTFSLICDIEGAEAQLIEREIEFLKSHAAWILIEMHDSITDVTELDHMLRSNGFHLIKKLHLAHCYQNQANGG